MSAAATHLEFAPPTSDGTIRSVAAALVVHALLIVALTAGIQWKQDNHLSVQAQLWSAVPLAAAPVEVEPLPVTPALPEPAQAAPPAPAPAQEADIVLAKKRKVEEEHKAKLKLEEDKRKLDAQKEEERKDKERQLKEAKKRQEQSKAQAEEAKKLEAIRNENMKRIAGLAGSLGNEHDTGSATKNAGPSDSYGGRIRARVKPNITFDPSSVSGNPAAEVEVRCAPDGTIVGRKLTKSSGNAAWDSAVLKAIDKTETLPRDTDGRVHTPLLLVFKPSD